MSVFLPYSKMKYIRCRLGVKLVIISVINKAVDFLLLKKINSAITYSTYLGKKKYRRSTDIIIVGFLNMRL